VVDRGIAGRVDDTDQATDPVVDVRDVRVRHTVRGPEENRAGGKDAEREALNESSHRVTPAEDRSTVRDAGES
jgi:hypothetical protein